jgi:hypothetical protein
LGSLYKGDDGRNRRPIMEHLYLGITVISTYTLVALALILAFV